MTTIDPSDWIDYLKYMLEQVKLQQDVRDRWFGYYLSIAGATLALGIAVVKLFYSTAFDLRLSVLLFALTATMFLIGVCFFMIYIRQRINYLSYYRTMQDAEIEFLRCKASEEQRIILSLSSNVPRRQTITPVRTIIPQRFGADFFTIWIHIIINSLYFAGIIFFAITLRNNSSAIAPFQLLASFLAFLLSALSLELIRRRSFK